jgi:viroplasmin and RNaseH domain-containing protein
MVDGVVEIHKTWEECKKRVHGVNAKYKKSISPEDEEEIIKEFKAIPN